MRTAFRWLDKECVIPEVSRSHHASHFGASVTNKKQFLLFDAMAFASAPTICGAQGACRQFGDVTYLLNDLYDAFLRKAINSAPLIASDRVQMQNALDQNTLYVLPFVHEEWQGLRLPLGIMPKGTQN